MSEHKYLVGQVVGLKSRLGMLPRGSHLFQVSQLVRLEDLPPQYRIVNRQDGTSMIVIEDEIGMFPEW